MTAYEAAVQEKDQLYARIQLVREEIKQVAAMIEEAYATLCV